MLSHEEKLNLIHALIHSGVNNSEQIINTVEVVDSALFASTDPDEIDDEALSIEGLRLKKLGKSSGSRALIDGSTSSWTLC